MRMLHARHARSLGADRRDLDLQIHRSSVLDGYADHIHQRRAEALIGNAGLHAELQTRGWRGSLRTVRRYLRPLRPAASTRRPAPTPRPHRTGPPAGS